MSLEQWIAAVGIILVLLRIAVHVGKGKQALEDVRDDIVESKVRLEKHGEVLYDHEKRIVKVEVKVNDERTHHGSQAEVGHVLP